MCLELLLDTAADVAAIAREPAPLGNQARLVHALLLKLKGL